MKRNFKRTLAKVMAVALTVAVAGTAAPDAAAAKKAKKARLSVSSVTLEKGKSKKVTIKNVKANKVKKLAVSTNKKAVATVKASGKTAFKVTAKKAGSAKITAKLTVKGVKKATKLSLNVKVKAAKVNKATAAPVASATPVVTAAPSATPVVSAAPSATPEASAPAATETPKATKTPRPKPTATPAWEQTAIKNIQLGGEKASKVTKFVVDDKGAATVILNDEAKYGYVYTYFDIELPEGSTIDDLYSVKFDFDAKAGDLENKKIYLLGGSPNEDSLDKFPGEFLYEWDPINKFTNVTNVSKDEYAISFSNEGKLEDNEFEIDTDLLKEMELKGNKIRFSIFAILDGVKGANTEYEISNIKVLGKKPVKDANTKPGDPIDQTANMQPEGLVALERGTVKVGDKISAEAVVKNSSIVGDVKEIKWSTSNADSIVKLTPNADTKTKASIEAKAAGVETVSVEITTTSDKKATFTKQIKVSADDVVIEDKVLDIKENNVITIKKDTPQAKGKGKIDISELIKDVDLADYGNITVYGTVMYGEDALEDSQTLTLMLVNSDTSDTGVVTAYDIKNSDLLASTEEGVTGGKAVLSQGNLETYIGGSNVLKLLFTNAVATSKDITVKVDKVVLNAKKAAAEEETQE